MNYAIAVIHQVDDLNKAQAFLSQALDFHLHEQGDGWAVMENGALSIRLISGAGQASNSLHLDINSNNLNSSLDFFSKQGFSHLGESHWVSQWREEIYLNGPYQIRLTLFREYNEDELEILPDLPTSINWHKDALELTRKLLKSVPITFRDSARVKVTECAEADAIVDGRIEVDLEIAVLSLVKVTPDFQHESLKQEMDNNGLNSSQFFK